MTISTRLLISVRNAEEALAALAGGADLVDVKEPARGPLGRADDAAIEAVVHAVGGKVPVSAALGELTDRPQLPRTAIDFAKWGLAGWSGRDWRSALGGVDAPIVAVAYADWLFAGSPSIHEVVEWVCKRPTSAFLIDTFTKDGRTLIDFLPRSELATAIEQVRSAGVPIALAGSLGPREIRELRGLAPDWLAVRGAACQGGREGTICPERVAELRRLLAA